MSEFVRFMRALGSPYCLIALIFCSPFSNFISASEARAITFFYSHQPPFEYTDENGQAAGQAIEKMQALASIMGTEISFAFNSVNRGILNLHSGEYDLSTAVSPSSALKRDFLVSNNPLYVIALVAIRLPATPPIKDIQFIGNDSFAALSDNAFDMIAPWLSQPDFVAQRYNVATKAQGLRLVELGRLPYMLTYADATLVEENGKFKADTLRQLPVYVIVSRQHPNSESLMQDINRALSTYSQHL